MDDRRARVCMLLMNNFDHDSRVEREASSLTAAGLDVTVVARLYGDVAPYEERNGIIIRRVEFGWPLLARLPLGLRLGLFPLVLPLLLASWLGGQSRPRSVSTAWVSTAMALLRRFATAASARLRGLFSIARQDRPQRSLVSRMITALSEWWRRSYPPARDELAQRGLLFRAAAKVFRVVRRVYRKVFCVVRRVYRKVFRVVRGAYRKVFRVVRTVRRRVFRVVRRVYRKVFRVVRTVRRRVFLVVRRVYRRQGKRLGALSLALAGIAEQADVYHAHDMNTLASGYAAARLAGGRLVYDSHELWSERNVPGGLSRREQARIRRAERFLIRRADAAITVNRSVASDLSRMYGVPEPHVVMNCPAYARADEGQPQFVDHIPRRDGQMVLLYLGRITINRGLEPLIQALVELEDVDLVMMGSGNLEYIESVRERASEYGVEQQMRIVDPVPHDQVVATASQGDAGAALFQNVCLSYYYSLPTKLFECIHAGLPVIVSDLPEMARIVREYDIGIACDPSDPTAIAAAVREMFSDPIRYDHMRQNTRRAARAFNWENEGAKLVRIYRELLACSGGGP